MENVASFSQYEPVRLLHPQNFILFLCLSIELPWSAQWHFSPMSFWGLHLRLSHNSSGSDGSHSWVHLLRDGTLLIHHGAKTIIWSYPPAPGPLCQIWYLGGWYYLSYSFFWVWQTSVAATQLWSQFDSPEGKMEMCLSASLLPARLKTLRVSSEQPNSCDQMTPYPLLSLKCQFDAQLFSHWTLTTSGIPLDIYLCIWPLSHPFT